MKEISDVFSGFGNVFGLHLIHQWLMFRFLMFRLLDIKKQKAKSKQKHALNGLQYFLKGKGGHAGRKL